MLSGMTSLQVSNRSVRFLTSINTIHNQIGFAKKRAHPAVFYFLSKVQMLIIFRISKTARDIDIILGSFYQYHYLDLETLVQSG